jgi:cytochrome c-type biogenesis protein CcmF
VFVPELGHFALILALCAAFFQTLTPCLAAYQNSPLWNQLTWRFAFMQLAFLCLSFCCLEYAFVANDFSVLYVASNSSSQLPIFYRFTALWGAHEGSVLLWILLLNIWSVGATQLGKRYFFLPYLPEILGVLGLISFGLLLFLLNTSNPFQRLLPEFPLQGQDLNPLLQDIGLVSHPPMLYLGYVGFAVVFAFAMVGMLRRTLKGEWLKAMQVFVALCWSFLTLGITLGSWWAYRELGWGGWWFWDPVENASFLPWLTGAALLHVLVLNQKKRTFNGWMILLAICGFSLSLMGTFLVRSGILTSVHAFANDPGRGAFLFGFLVLIIGGSLCLYAWRFPSFQKKSPQFSVFSRESFLLANSLLLMLAMATILLGTLYPLILDVLNQEKISVGAPYFNIVFAPLMLIALFLMVLAPLSRWKHAFSTQILQAMIIGGGLGLLLYFVLRSFILPWGAMLGVILASWVIVMTLKSTVSSIKSISNKYESSQRKALLKVLAMAFAHGGVALCALGIILTSMLSVERDVKMAPGDSASVGPYTFKFMALSDLKGPNFKGVQVEFKAAQAGEEIAVLTAEKRIYNAQKMGFTKAAILPGVWRDLYVALGEPLTEQLDGPWAVRLYYKPFVRWLWVGGFLILIGGLFSAASGMSRSVITENKR